MEQNSIPIINVEGLKLLKQLSEEQAKAKFLGMAAANTVQECELTDEQIEAEEREDFVLDVLEELENMQILNEAETDQIFRSIVPPTDNG